MKDILLLPSPRRMERLPGVCALTAPVGLPMELAALDTVCPGCFRFGEPGDVVIGEDASMAAEHYVLEVGEDTVNITAGSASGAFYALVTLGQLVRQGLPCCRIEDGPDLKMRGFLLDIGRGRVPTMDTLCRLADLLAGFKYNQLQLYMEGFPFEYPSFPQCMEGQTPLTGEELRQFDRYCAQRHIELVPTQNSLGHMAHWLARPEFRHLAEREEGLNLFGKTFPSTTLNASDPESLRLVERMLDDLLPNFTSSRVNVGLDEAFELGQGKNADFVSSYGKDALFLSYTKKLHEAVSVRGRKMMMWADAVAGSELLLKELPRDILFLEWGYEAEHPFAVRAQAFQEAGRQFCVCPGTSSWSSFTGITDNMLINIRSAAKAAKNYGAMGMLLTDWGDMGHLQPPAVSWPGLLFAGTMAWGLDREPSEEDLALGLDLFVYGDKTGKMGQFCLDAGRYRDKEEFRMACRTLACLPILLGPMEAANYQQVMPRFAAAMANMAPEPLKEIYIRELENRREPNGETLTAEIQSLLTRLEETQLTCPDGGLVKQEYALALNTVLVLTKARLSIAQGKRPRALAGELEALAEGYRELWPLRAKTAGLEPGIAGIVRLQHWFSGGEKL